MLQPYNPNNLYLFVMRGIPGCGKSNFVKNYMTKISNIIESDIIREKINGRIIKNDKESISQLNNNIVWKEIFNQLEESLKLHKSTTIDATNISIWQLKIYEKLANRYNAELIIIDFSDVSLTEAKIRNSLRLPEYKRVPEKVIEKMHRNLLKQNTNMHSFRVLHNHDEILYWLKEII